MQDVYKTAEAIKAAGGKITREPGPLQGRASAVHTSWKRVYNRFQLTLLNNKE